MKLKVHLCPDCMQLWTCSDHDCPFPNRWPCAPKEMVPALERAGIRSWLKLPPRIVLRGDITIANPIMVETLVQISRMPDSFFDDPERPPEALAVRGAMTAWLDRHPYWKSALPRFHGMQRAACVS